MISTLLQRFGAWLDRRNAIHQLATLDDRLLADMGVSRGDIARRVNGLAAAPPPEAAAAQSGSATGWNGLSCQLLP